MGLTFLNGIFGLALAAVSVPILIHLLNRRRSRREQFSSLDFLDEVTRKQRRRIQLRQWLLLALRVLIILLVALAMMRPAIQTSGAGGSGSTTAVLVFDDSFSMAAATEERSRIEAARDRVDELAGLVGEGDRVQMLFPSSPPVTAFDGAVHDMGRVQAVARQSEIAFTRASHRAALADALRLLEASESLNREIYVVSDFQEGDWGGDEPFAEIPENVRVYLVPVGSEDLPNVGVASASFVQASVQAGASGAVRVTLANYSDDALSGYPIQVFRGDEVVAEGALRVARDDMATIDLPLSRAVATGEALEVRIAEDALAVDDRAFVTPGERQTLRVLIVHGGTPEGGDPEPYLGLALDPPGEAGARVFSVEQISLRDLPVQTDLDFDVFVLNNVERLSEGVVARLKLAHRDGAGLFVILGDRVDLRYYNEHVLPELLDVTLDQPASSSASFFTLRPEVAGHPIFDGFKVGSMEDLSAARFNTVVRTHVGENARILARLGQHAALVEGERVLLMTTSADLRWGNFPTGGSFLPLMHQAVLTLASAALEARQFKAGAPIVLDVPLADVPGEVVCLTPEGTELPAVRTVRSGRVEIRTRPAPEPGVYRFLTAGEPLRDVAVHLDAEEGRLRSRDPAAIAASLGETVRVLAPGESSVSRVMEDRQGREIWQELIALALLLAIAETVIGRVRMA
jgi:hypothetical protein